MRVPSGVFTPSVVWSGSELTVLWFDCENVIQADPVDVVNDRSTFFLLLLMLQRLDRGMWGHFTCFEQSPVRVIEGDDQTFFASFRGANTRSGEPKRFTSRPYWNLNISLLAWLGAEHTL